MIMKMLRYLILLIFVISGVQACNNPRNKGKDAVYVAKKANESKDTVDYINITGPGSEFPATANLPFSDPDFAVDAADQDMLEMQLGKIALKNSSNQEIKDFGQMMIDDYTTANNKLIALAKQKNIVLPSSPSQKNLKHINDLNDRTGDDFDKHYIDFIVANHKRTLRLFENASRNADDVELKAFATNRLPIIKKHLAAAKALKDKF